jgi:hypothetical protein
MDLYSLLNHTAPNAPPPASQNAITATTPPLANTNYVDDRPEARNAGSGSQAQKLSPRTKYPKLAPAPTPTAAYTTNSFSTGFSAYAPTAPHLQPRVPSPPSPWTLDTSVILPRMKSPKTMVVDHLEERRFSNHSTLTELFDQHAQTSGLIAKPSIPESNNIVVGSGTPDDVLMRKNEGRKRKREEGDEHAMSGVVEAENEASHGFEPKRRKQASEERNVNGETSYVPLYPATLAATDGGTATAFLSSQALPRTGAGNPDLAELPKRVTMPIETNQTLPPAKRVKQKSEKKSKKGVKIEVQTKTVEKNGWVCFQRVMG